MQSERSKGGGGLGVREHFSIDGFVNHLFTFHSGKMKFLFHFYLLFFQALRTEYIEF